MASPTTRVLIEIGRKPPNQYEYQSTSRMPITSHLTTLVRGGDMVSMSNLPRSLVNYPLSYLPTDVLTEYIRDRYTSLSKGLGIYSVQ